MNSFPASEPFSEMGKAMLVAGMSLLIAAAVSLFTAERDLRHNNAEVQRANAALLQLAEIKHLVIGVDYSARGYSLTGERLFLDHENEKQRDLKTGIAKLRRLTDPELAGDIAQLSRLIAKHASVYANFVAQGPLRTKEMAALITNPVERKKRYAVLDELERLNGAIMADLVHHQSLAVKQQRYTLILTFVIVMIAFLGPLVDWGVKRIGRSRRVALRVEAK